MKKHFNMGKYINIAGILLMIGFVIRLSADYYKYRIGSASAPFYTSLIERSIDYLLPAVICFIVSIYLKKREC